MWCDLLQEVWGAKSCEVRGRQVDGEATVVTGALEAVVFLLFLGELAICSNAWVGPTGRGGIR